MHSGDRSESYVAEKGNFWRLRGLGHPKSQNPPMTRSSAVAVIADRTAYDVRYIYMYIPLAD